MASLAVRGSEARAPVVGAGVTDVGRRREHNEDRILVSQDLGVFAVADGMGGHQAGDVASTIAVAALESFVRDPPEPESLPEGYETLTPDEQRVVQAVMHCNRAVYAESGRSTTDGGMGSTLVAILVRPEEGVLHVAHVGDSRCYRVRDGGIEQLTEDHSMRNEARRRKMSEDIVKKLPANVVTRALGMKDHAQPDVRTEALCPGDVYLLCSDGLSGAISDEDMLFALLESDNLQTACELLITMANDAGGRDNISAVLVRVEEAGAEHALELEMPSEPSAKGERVLELVPPARAVREAPSADSTRHGPISPPRPVLTAEEMEFSRLETPIIEARSELVSLPDDISVDEELPAEPARASEPDDDISVDEEPLEERAAQAVASPAGAALPSPPPPKPVVRAPSEPEIGPSEDVDVDEDLAEEAELAIDEELSAPPEPPPKLAPPPPKLEAAKPQPVSAIPASREPPKPEVARAKSASSKPSKQEAAPAKPAKPEPAKPAKPEPAKPAKPEPAKPAKPEPAKPVAASVKPSKAAPPPPSEPEPEAPPTAEVKKKREAKTRPEGVPRLAPEVVAELAKKTPVPKKGKAAKAEPEAPPQVPASRVAPVAPPPPVAAPPPVAPPPPEPHEALEPEEEIELQAEELELDEWLGAPDDEPLSLTRVASGPQPVRGLSAELTPRSVRGADGVVDLTRKKPSIAPSPARMPPPSGGVIKGIPIVPIGDPSSEPRPRPGPRPRCRNCGHPPLPGEHFCGMCGTNLESRPPPSRRDPSVPRCTNCDAKLIAGTRYCIECGVRLRGRR